MSSVTEVATPAKAVIYRHSVLVRITHWINVLCITVLIMSGLQIFNAHPALYWGQKSDFEQPLLRMGARLDTDGKPVGVTSIFGASYRTTGLFGLSGGEARGFPSWATIPSYRDLATGRRWHFFFAWLFVINGAVYVVASLINRHVWRDLVPTRGQLRGIGRSIWDHLRLRFNHGKAYNVLQKLVYLAMIFVVLPLVVLAGLVMSPGLDSAFPWLVDLFGGRQTARTIHFIAATAIILFIVVHVVMVLISGFWNNMRSIITGRYAADLSEKSDG